MVPSLVLRVSGQWFGVSPFKSSGVRGGVTRIGFRFQGLVVRDQSFRVCGYEVSRLGFKVKEKGFRFTALGFRF